MNEVFISSDIRICILYIAENSIAHCCLPYTRTTANLENVSGKKYGLLLPCSNALRQTIASRALFGNPTNEPIYLRCTIEYYGFFKNTHAVLYSLRFFPVAAAQLIPGIGERK